MIKRENFKRLLAVAFWSLATILLILRIGHAGSHAGTAIVLAVPKNPANGAAWWVASDWDTEKPDPVVAGDYFVLGAGALDATETISESGITLNVVGNTTSTVTISGDNNEIWYRQGSALTITDNGTGNVVVKNCSECE